MYKRQVVTGNLQEKKWGAKGRIVVTVANNDNGTNAPNETIEYNIHGKMQFMKLSLCWVHPPLSL